MANNQIRIRTRVVEELLIRKGEGFTESLAINQVEMVITVMVQARKCKQREK